MTRYSLPVCATGLLALFAMSASAQTYEVTIAHNPPTYATAAAEAFAAYVENATNGDIVVRTVSYGALGSGREVADQLRFGEIEFFIAAVADISGIYPEAQVHNWPLMFLNRSEFWGLANDAEHVVMLRERLLEASGDTIRLFTLAENSIRHLYTTRGPIRTPDDLRGDRIKMRTMTIPMHQSVWEALGSPQIVAISAPERYQSLQSGLIDGLEGGLASAWGAGLMEVAKYATLTGHMYDYHWLIGNEEFFQSLPDGYKEIIAEAARVAQVTQKATVVQDDLAALRNMIEAGVTVTVPTTAEMQQWQDLATPVAVQFLEAEIDQEVIDGTFAALERVREGLKMD